MPEEEIEQVEEEPSFKEKRRQINQHNVENNEKNIRAAATVLKDKGIPYASAIARGVDIADKASGGRSTKHLAKQLNTLNKIAPQGRKMQKKLNKLGDSGAADAVNKYANSSSTDEKGNFTVKFPLKYKIMLYGGIIALGIVCLMIFVVLFGNEISQSDVIDTSAYGQTCPMITVIDTGCDSSGQNCTNQYNGDFEFETYVAGAVAAKVGNINNYEYYKSVAIAVRTYAQSNAGSDCVVLGNVNFQEFIEVETSANVNSIKQAVEDTKSIVMTQNGDIVSTVWSINQQEAIGLINNNSYSYEQILKKYYGEDIELTNNVIVLSGINGFVNPTRIIYCTSPFSERIMDGALENHTGLDLGAMPEGEPIFAAKSGTIVAVTKDVTETGVKELGYGNYVKIDHGDGTMTLYAHMKYGSIKDSIIVGKEVKQGEQIGQVGSTGYSYGDHLHYEVIKNGTFVDPADYIDMTNATGTCKS